MQGDIELVAVAAVWGVWGFPVEIKNDLLILHRITVCHRTVAPIVVLCVTIIISRVSYAKNSDCLRFI